MEKLNTNDVVGIHQANSVDFIKSVFQVYNSGKILAILKQSNAGFGVEREITPVPGGGWADFRQDLIFDDRHAQIVFTSGTESTPKAILLSHRALADAVVRLNSIMRVDNTISEYVGVPVTYSFGLGRCRAIAAIGGRCFIPDNGFDPAELVRMLTADEINAISAVPTLWRTLLAQPEIIGALGGKVKWIEIGSQYMSRGEKDKMKQLFPNAIIVQHYGLTEASRTSFLKISETTDDLLESIGKTTGEVDVKISPMGLIMIRGPHVATGQIIGGHIKPLTDADGWFTTGDFGRIENNHIYYGGRADDLINCAGVKVNPESLQENINRRLNVDNKIAVCRINDDLRGDGFFIAVEKGGGLNTKALMNASFDELISLGVNAKSSIKVQEVEKIPRTDTGKVQRKELSKLYLDIKYEKKEVSRSGKDASVLDLYSNIFRDENIKLDDTFDSLGGDSLNYVQMIVLLEKRFGFTPRDWDRMTIRSLQDIERKKETLFCWIETTVFLRVIAIMAVVATHSGVAVLGGGTLMLFALIGYNMARFKSADFFAGKIWQWLKVYSIIIFIPYLLIAVLDQSWSRSFQPDVILLYANLVSAKITVIFPYWFVQVLLQSLVLFGIMFSVPSLRTFAQKTPVVFSFTVLAFLIAVRVIYPFFWDTKYLNNLVPLRFMAIMWLGWCFYFVKGWQQRLLLCSIGVGFAFFDTGRSTITTWLVSGSIFLAFVPRVPIPSFSKKAFNAIAAATLYIFICNGLIIVLLGHIVPFESAFIVFCITMLGCLSVWWTMERLRLVTRMQALLKVRT